MKLTSHILIALMVLVTATAAAAQDAPSVERGSKLFNSAALGTNGKSCATCHPGGKGLEDVADYDGKKMATYVNNCIKKALKGKPLADDSADMGSLVMYLNKLGKAKSK
ncbi:MAG: cytochrome C [Desulfuromonadaceae bacterium]